MNRACSHIKQHKIIPFMAWKMGNTKGVFRILFFQERFKEGLDRVCCCAAPDAGTMTSYIKIVNLNQIRENNFHFLHVETLVFLCVAAVIPATRIWDYNGQIVSLA